MIAEVHRDDHTKELGNPRHQSNFQLGDSAPGSPETRFYRSLPCSATGDRRRRGTIESFRQACKILDFSRPRMAGRGPREVGMAAVCGAGGSERSVADHRGVHGPAEEVVAPVGLDGTPIELLLRDQKAVAQQGQGTVVLRRWLLPALARAGIGWATCWPCRDRVPEFGATASFFVVASWRSVCHFGSRLLPCLLGPGAMPSGLMR